jgi:hypothetical protein
MKQKKMKKEGKSYFVLTKQKEKIPINSKEKKKEI